MANKRHNTIKKKVVSFTIDEDTIIALTDLADKLNISKSSIMQKALIKYLAQVKKVQQ